MMKNITTRFVLTNIVSAIVLIISLPLVHQERQELIDDKQDVLKGAVILGTFILGFILRIIKSKAVSVASTGEMSFLEKMFLGLLFLFSLSATINFVMISSTYLYGDGMSSQGQMIYGISLMMISVCIIFYEAAMVLSSGSNYSKDKPKRKWVDPLYSYYIGFGIALSWDVMVVGGSSGLSFDMENFWSEFIATIFLALMMVVSIQRLFWFEVFTSSTGWKDNLKVIASVVLVLASAIVPLFYK
ncbi:MAG: hypothetical protein ACI837_002711 [Crocinitomicaceae bacterium]|jgi:hypothetical protein